MQTKLLEDNSAVVHAAVGKVCMADILTAIHTWFTHPDFDSERAVIWDLNTAFVDVTMEDMRNAYGLVRDRVDSKRSGGKTAWVHQSALVRAMIDIVSDEFDWGSKWGTFEHLERALTWCQQNGQD